MLVLFAISTGTCFSSLSLQFLELPKSVAAKLLLAFFAKPMLGEKDWNRRYFVSRDTQCPALKLACLSPVYSPSSSSGLTRN